MARTIANIKTTIVNAVQSDANLAALTSISNVADWNLWAYIVAVCQWTLEKLFDAHISEVQTILSAQKPHTLQWYVTMAKAFQYGDDLPQNSDAYAVIDSTKQIVSYASATETGTGLRIKVAALSGSDLAAIPPTPQLAAFTAYMQLVKDAGVRLTITSGQPDRFVTELLIYYNPLILDASGQRLDGTNNTPVQDAITSFLNNLPFNGLFVLNSYIAALQAVDGVVIADVQSAQATYGALPLTDIPVQYPPDAGYMAIDLADDLNLTFTPHAPI
jgi:hypothetical protein